MADIADIEEEMKDEDTQKGKYMTFQSGNEYYGIGINYVNEIIGIQKITSVPETEDYIKGLINLRGKIIPVIDVRLRFRQEPIEYTDRTCIIVTDIKNVVVGLIVQTIAEVVSIDDTEIAPPPALAGNGGGNKYVYGIGKVGDSVKLLLDPDKLINDKDVAMFEQMSE